MPDVGPAAHATRALSNPILMTDFTMFEPTLEFVTCPDAQGGHRMAYWQWGKPDSAHVVLCVHGLTRQGRDFDVLAQALCRAATHIGKDIRVVCPDVVGRGKSDWLKDPMGYQIPHYAADMLALLAQLNASTLDWVGTSMGGLIGMVVAGAQGEALLWQAYDHITAETLLVRGADSDLLSRQTAQAMTQRGPRARLIEFAGVGHAPTFVADDQVQAVCAFLFA